MKQPTNQKWVHMCIYDSKETKGIWYPGTRKNSERLYRWYRATNFNSENDEPNFLIYDFKKEKYILELWQKDRKITRQNNPALIIEDCKIWFTNGVLDRIENLDLQNQKQLRLVGFWLRKEISSFSKIAGTIARIKYSKSLIKYLVSDCSTERILAKIRLEELKEERNDQ